MSTLLGVLIIPVFFLLLITITCMWEKRLVWPYIDYQEGADTRLIPEATSRTQQTIQAARSVDFVPIATGRDGKGKLYRVRYEFLRSASGDVLALIGSGSVAGTPVQGIWLYSFLEDGRCLVTLDQQNGSEIDLAGITEEKLIGDAYFERLLAAHRQRLARATSAPVPFSSTVREDVLEQLRQYRARRTQLLVDRGMASYLDGDQKAWRYTPKGAITLAFRGYVIGMRRVFVPDRVA